MKPLVTGSTWVLLAALLAGVAGGLVVLPTLFRRIPTDLSRVGVLLQALRTAKPPPEVVIFGSSPIGSCLDARLLSETLPGHPLAFNLSSALQTLAESYLYYQELPPSVRVIVQMVSERQLARSIPFEANKFNAYYMYGYRPGPRTREAFRRIYGRSAVELMERSAIGQTFLARWTLRSYLDVGFADALRHDFDIDRFTNDLFHPQGFRDRIPEARFRENIETWLSSWPEPDPETTRQVRALFAEMIGSAKEGGRRFVAFAPPVHPEVRARMSEAVRQEFEALLVELGGSSGVLVVDARDVLEASAFRDAIHAHDIGTARVTALLSDRLATLLPAARLIGSPRR